MQLITESENLQLYTQENINTNKKGLANETDFWCMLKEDKGNKSASIGRFTLVPMPACCGLVISTDLYLNTKYRGTEIGKEFLTLKEWTAKMLGYPAIIATTQIDNVAEQKSMTKRGYKEIAQWKNTKTNNQLNLIFKVL